MLNFYKNKKILITGHNGFKGAWLCLILYFLGAKLYGISLKKDDKKNVNLIKIFLLKKKIREFFFDINEYKILNKVINKIEPSIIFHLAAQSLVIESYKNPRKTFDTNITGLINIFQSLKNKKFCKIISVITSDKCYVNTSKKILNENSCLGGDDPYSASKACAEILTNCYRKSFFMNSNTKIITFRAGNVIGGGDFNKDRLIPDIIKKIFYKKKLFIRNLHFKRPWQDVIDVNISYLKFTYIAVKRLKNFNSLNIGPNRNYTVKQIIKKFNLIKEFQYSQLKPKVEEKKNISLSTTLSKKILKEKKTPIDITIKNIFFWNKAFLERKNMFDISINMIKKVINENY